MEERARAARFAEQWRGETYEKGEAQTFWNEFFEIFGRSRRSVAVFERYAKRLEGYGFIDLFWPGVLIVEHKSAGRSLEEAMQQADEYAVGLSEKQMPRYILACDFATFHLVDLEECREHRFALEDLPDNAGLFGFMADRPSRAADIDPVNQKATAIMGRIYESLAGSGYPAGGTERLLTRLAFCMFADDSGIFRHGSFGRYVEELDGRTLGPMLHSLFQLLDTPPDARQKGADDEFPYVDGRLFGEDLPVAALSNDIQQMLVKADSYDWSRINPAIFGGMFQVVMDDEERRQAGAHYTTKENIMRVIRPLFLDDLRTELEEARSAVNKEAALKRFQDKLARLTFLDPACGSGNFLAIAYRELRRLELEVILELHDTKKQLLDVSRLSKVDVNQFYGIEVNPFSVQIARISMWMTDHLMNRELGDRYGLAYLRIPLRQSPNIVHADALEAEWQGVLPAAECSYVLGNPPYAGSKMQTPQQREQVRRIADLGGSGGTLDYVAAWFIKAARYTESNPRIRIGYVATNSITQGEQVGQLWPILLDNFGLRIEFGYRSFRWGSEAPGMAHVHVVIIGLGRETGRTRRLFHPDGDLEPEENPPAISPYLAGVKKTQVVTESTSPLNGLPKIGVGSQSIDGGHYIFTNEEKVEFLEIEPDAEQYVRPYISADDFIHGRHRWILDLHDADPSALSRLPEVKKRINRVRSFRLKSSRKSTLRAADTPSAYGLKVIPDKPFLVVPRISSERRRYIPIGYAKPPIIPSDNTMIIQGASLALFGLLTSHMHMVWLAYIGGRLKSDYRYSAGIVYNAFPVPDSSLDALEPYARAVLDARAAHPESTLADLYDNTTMPTNLVKAHRRLDREVDRLYRKKTFGTDLERIEFLLERYEGMT